MTRKQFLGSILGVFGFSSIGANALTPGKEKILEKNKEEPLLTYDEHRRVRDKTDIELEEYVFDENKNLSDIFIELEHIVKRNFAELENKNLIKCFCVYNVSQNEDDKKLNRIWINACFDTEAIVLRNGHIARNTTININFIYYINHLRHETLKKVADNTAGELCSHVGDIDNSVTRNNLKNIVKRNFDELEYKKLIKNINVSDIKKTAGGKAIGIEIKYEPTYGYFDKNGRIRVEPMKHLFWI